MLKSKWLRGVAIGVASAVVGAILLFTGVLDGLESSTFDIRARLFSGPTPTSSQVVVVHVDQTDLDSLDSNFNVGWPWPRSIYSYIVDFANLAGAASITFDVILEDEGTAGYQDDELLQYSAETFGRSVFGAEFFTNAKENALLPAAQQVSPELWPEYVQRPNLESLLSEEDASLLGESFLEASFPYEYVVPPNAVVAFVQQTNDADGVFRRYRLINFHVDQPVPSLALAPIIAQTSEMVPVTYADHFMTVGDLKVPVGDDGKVLIRYTVKRGIPGPEEVLLDPTERTSFFARELIFSLLGFGGLLEREIPPEALAGKHVIVGLSASGLYDLRPTPLDGRSPGVTLHAQMLENLLSGEFMRDFPRWATLVMLLVMTVGAAIGATYIEKTWLMALAILGFLALPFGLAFGGYALGYWFQFVVPLIVVFVALAGANVANYATEGAARRQIRGMFGRYLSPDVISELEQDPSALELGGKEAEITIYFSDIQKFSTISTKLKPDELVQFLNVYLTPMTNAILEEGGLIDKYEGDAIIAMWGAPREREDHARAGLRSMLKCQAALDQLRPGLKEQIGTDVFQRIGMSTGKATVGNMGSELRTDYTMIGDAVNLAARLEGANKAFGTYSMVSQDTINSAGGLDAVRREVCSVRELGYIAVVGREDKPVRVYEPMQEEAYNGKSDVYAAYQKGITLFQAGEFSEALSVFDRIKDLDAAAMSYIPRCEELMASRPVDWNGVWVLTEKG